MSQSNCYHFIVVQKPPFSQRADAHTRALSCFGEGEGFIGPEIPDEEREQKPSAFITRLTPPATFGVSDLCHVSSLVFRDSDRLSELRDFLVEWAVRVRLPSESMSIFGSFTTNRWAPFKSPETETNAQRTTILVFLLSESELESPWLPFFSPNNRADLIQLDSDLTEFRKIVLV